MSKKLLLIFPSVDQHKEFHHIPYSSLALAAPLEHLGIDYDIFDERVQDQSMLPELLRRASVVGITLYTGYQTYRAYELLKYIKTLNPSLVTIVGGPHATALPLQTMECEYVDYVVAGFADQSFCNLVTDIFEYGRQKHAICGVFHQGNSFGDGLELPINKRETKFNRF